MSQRDPIMLKIIILGDSGVGKSCLLGQYVNKKFNESYKSTVGADFLTREVVIGGQHVVLQLWDTAGQERYRSIASTFFRGAHCCILVFDLTAAESLNSLDGWLKEFIKHSELLEANHFPFVLLGNKVDLNTRRVIPLERVQAYCKATGNMPYFEVSAKNAVNLEQAFQSIAEIALKFERPDEANRENHVSLPISDKAEKGKSGGCC